MIGKVSIEKMIMRLALSDLDDLTDTALINLFIKGCRGYENMSDEEIVGLYNDYILENE